MKTLLQILRLILLFHLLYFLNSVKIYAQLELESETWQDFELKGRVKHLSDLIRYSEGRNGGKNYTFDEDGYLTKKENFVYYYANSYGKLGNRRYKSLDEQPIDSARGSYLYYHRFKNNSAKVLSVVSEGNICGSTYDSTIYKYDKQWNYIGHLFYTTIRNNKGELETGLSIERKLAFDEKRRLVKEIIIEHGTRYHYERNRKTDSIYYFYDSLSKLIEKRKTRVAIDRKYDSHRAHILYNAAGNITDSTLTDLKGNLIVRYQISYDSLERLKSVKIYDSQNKLMKDESYFYNAITGMHIEKIKRCFGEPDSIEKFVEEKLKKTVFYKGNASDPYRVQREKNYLDERRNYIRQNDLDWDWNNYYRNESPLCPFCVGSDTVVSDFSLYTAKSNWDADHDKKEFVESDSTAGGYQPECDGLFHFYDAQGNVVKTIKRLDGKIVWIRRRIIQYY